MICTQLNNTLFNYSLYLNMATNETVNNEKKDRLVHAVELLYDDYMNDPELTAFSILDQEDFLVYLPNQIDGI